MRTIQKGNGYGEIAYIFRSFSSVQYLNMGDIAGYVEQWYSGGSHWEGIRVDEEKITYARLVGGGQGLALGNVGFYGIGLQDKFYDEKSFLVNGVVLTHCARRENFGRKESLPKMKVSERMPEHILSILGEEREKVLETAKLLRLPLEEVVCSHSRSSK